MGRAAHNGREPTPMGERILALMKLRGLDKNKTKFAEKQLGISKQRFQRWIFDELGDVEAKPLLRCAKELGTNPPYILGESDDPRPAVVLKGREGELLEAFRDLSQEDQDRLMTLANDWVARTRKSPNHAAPFRVPLPSPKDAGGKRVAHKRVKK